MIRVISPRGFDKLEFTKARRTGFWYASYYQSEGGPFHFWKRKYMGKHQADALYRDLLKAGWQDPDRPKSNPLTCDMSTSDIIRETRINRKTRKKRPVKQRVAIAYAQKRRCKGNPRSKKPDWVRYSHAKRKMYHASRSEKPFNTFDMSKSDLGPHFGTLEQAEHRANMFPENASIFPVWLNITNPLRLKDVGSFHADAIADQLRRKKIISRALEKEIAQAYEKDWRSRKKYDRVIKKAIIDAGYDGIVYKNQHEGQGDSYIAFYPQQIKSAMIGSIDHDLKDPIMHNPIGKYPSSGLQIIYADPEAYDDPPKDPDQVLLDAAYIFDEVGLSPRTNQYHLVAYAQGQPVGAVAARKDREGYHYDVAVLPNHRRSNVGLRLMDTIEAEYEDIKDDYREAFGNRKWRIQVQVINDRLRKHLKKHRGYKEAGKAPIGVYMRKNPF